MTDSPPFLLKVAAFGKQFLVEDMTPQQTVLDLQTRIEELTQVSVRYQRMLSHGKQLGDDPSQTLQDVGVQHRTKLMVLHNQLYAQEKQGWEALQALQREIESLEEAKSKMAKAIVHERVTQLCCRLDAVSVQGSDYLRQRRKELLQRAERIDAAETSSPASEDPS